NALFDEEVVALQALQEIYRGEGAFGLVAEHEGPEEVGLGDGFAAVVVNALVAVEIEWAVAGKACGEETGRDDDGQAEGRDDPGGDGDGAAGDGVFGCRWSGHGGGCNMRRGAMLLRDASETRGAVMFHRRRSGGRGSAARRLGPLPTRRVGIPHSSGRLRF